MRKMAKVCWLIYYFVYQLHFSFDSVGVLFAFICHLSIPYPSFTLTKRFLFVDIAIRLAYLSFSLHRRDGLNFRIDYDHCNII
jgi:hypothetical protein